MDISDPSGKKLEPFAGGFEAVGKYFCFLDLNEILKQ
jgi:hypothetical protein